MHTSLVPGKYIVAVSGGVDSVVLLDLLTKQTGLELVVAHFDHGIRKDSAKDREFVATLSQKYGLPFEFAEGKLGKDASEEEARRARYEFLQQIRKKYRSDSIVTAHHQDDVIETMCINLLRGTGRLGLSSLGSGKNIKRPLLHVCKTEITDYAKKHGLEWREDSTNQDTAYLRNWLRHKILNTLSKQQRKQFIDLYENASVRNQEINTLLSGLIGEDSSYMRRSTVINAPHDVSKELIAHWLRDNGIREFDQKTLERASIAAKTLSPGKTIPLKNKHEIIIHADKLSLEKHR